MARPLRPEDTKTLRQYLSTSNPGTIDLKIAILGAPQTGKQALLWRIVSGAFLQAYNSHRGDLLPPITLLIHDSIVKISLEEAAIESLVPTDSAVDSGLLQGGLNLLRQSDGVMLLYDPFHAESTLGPLRRLHAAANGSDIDKKKYFVVASFADNASPVPKTKGLHFSREIGATHLEVSAKTGQGCSREDLGDIVAQILLHKAKYSKVKLEKSSKRVAVQKAGGQRNSIIRKLMGRK